MTKYSARESAPEHIERLNLAENAIKLRASGATYRAIAQALKVSVSTAHSLVDSAIQERKEHRAARTDALVELELERCDQLQLALAKEVAKGNPKAVTATIRVMDRRAKLLGLDAAKKFEHSGPEGGALKIDSDMLLAKLARLAGGESAPADADGEAGAGAEGDPAGAVAVDQPGDRPETG